MDMGVGGITLAILFRSSSANASGAILYCGRVDPALALFVARNSPLAIQPRTVSGFTAYRLAI
jgi:hypothetical protein